MEATAFSGVSPNTSQKIKVAHRALCQHRGHFRPMSTIEDRGHAPGNHFRESLLMRIRKSGTLSASDFSSVRALIHSVKGIFLEGACLDKRNTRDANARVDEAGSKRSTSTMDPSVGAIGHMELGKNIFNKAISNGYHNILGKAMSINPCCFCSKKPLGHEISLSPF